MGMAIKGSGLVSFPLSVLGWGAGTPPRAVTLLSQTVERAKPQPSATQLGLLCVVLPGWRVPSRSAEPTRMSLDHRPTDHPGWGWGAKVDLLVTGAVGVLVLGRWRSVVRSGSVLGVRLGEGSKVGLVCSLGLRLEVESRARIAAQDPKSLAAYVDGLTA